MDTEALYATFTNPKVLTSMLLLGIGLGLILSALIRYTWGQWPLPVVFAVICIVTLIVYGYWLDRQDFRDD